MLVCKLIQISLFSHSSFSCVQTCWLISLSSGTAVVVVRDLRAGAARTPTHVPSDKWDTAQTSIQVSKKINIFFKKKQTKNMSSTTWRE